MVWKLEKYSVEIIFVKLSGKLAALFLMYSNRSHAPSIFSRGNRILLSRYDQYIYSCLQELAQVRVFILPEMLLSPCGSPPRELITVDTCTLRVSWLEGIVKEIHSWLCLPQGIRYGPKFCTILLQTTHEIQDLSLSSLTASVTPNTSLSSDSDLLVTVKTSIGQHRTRFHLLS